MNAMVPKYLKMRHIKTAKKKFKRKVASRLKAKQARIQS
jgi:hypothetical protein